MPSNISRPSSARSPTVPAVSSPSPIVIRAKVSNTARTRTHSTTSSPAGIIGSTNPNGNVVLRPQSHEVRRRSPSPAKMVVRPPSPSKSSRPPSPSKLTSKPTHVVRTASRAALNPSRSDVSHRVHVSTVFGP
ncbi:MAG TPA: hypothetical protein VGO47_06110, partial [Chlamydiales bacterium]|nr:hypothetical protein [Chlamydiales bacterium]